MPDEQETKDQTSTNNEELTKVLEELKTAADRLTKTEEEKPKPVVNTNTINERRAALQKSLGFNDEQMLAHEQMIRDSQAPLIETQAWSALDKKSDIDTYRSEIQQEISLYPQASRTPELLEKVYYMVRGKHADSKPATKDSKSSGVERTRVSSGPGYSGNDPGLSSSGSDPKTESTELDEKEKFVADKLGVDHKGYAQSKKVGKEIRELRTPDQRPATSLADIELRRLTGRR